MTIKLTAEAKKAGTPEELGLREGSARYKLMAYCFKSAAKGFEREALTKVVGEQAAQAIRVMVKHGFLAEVE